MATAARLIVRRRDRKFYLCVALAAIAVVFAGFARTYYLNGYFEHRTLTWFLYLHGFLFSAWFVVVLTQIVLVAMGRTDLHRRLGKVGAAMVCIMVPMGVAVGIHAAKYGSLSTPPNVPRLSFLVVPLTDMVVFGTLAGAGLLYRRKPEIHRRLMILATLSILTAAIGRLPLSFIQVYGISGVFGLTGLLVLLFIAYDTISHRRLHPANLWGGLLIYASFFRLSITGTEVWSAFARWVTSLA